MGQQTPLGTVKVWGAFLYLMNLERTPGMPHFSLTHPGTCDDRNHPEGCIVMSHTSGQGAREAGDLRKREKQCGLPLSCSILLHSSSEAATN